MPAVGPHWLGRLVGLFQAHQLRWFWELCWKIQICETVDFYARERVVLREHKNSKSLIFRDEITERMELGAGIRCYTGDIKIDTGASAVTHPNNGGCLKLTEIPLLLFCADAGVIDEPVSERALLGGKRPRMERSCGHVSHLPANVQ